MIFSVTERRDGLELAAVHAAEATEPFGRAFESGDAHCDRTRWCREAGRGLVIVGRIMSKGKNRP